MFRFLGFPPAVGILINFLSDALGFVKSSLLAVSHPNKQVFVPAVDDAVGAHVRGHDHMCGCVRHPFEEVRPTPPDPADSLLLAKAV